MSDTRLNTAMNANGNIETEHASASAAFSSGASLDATEKSLHTDGGAAVDASASPTLPELPDAPEAVGEARSTLESAAGDALEPVGGVPDVPDVGGTVEGGVTVATDAAVDGTSFSFDGMLDGWLDVMGDLMAQFSGSLTSLVGF